VALPIEDVAAAASVMFLLLFGGVNVALIRLRKLRLDLDRGFRVPFVPFTPILAILCMLVVAVFMARDYPLSWVAAGGWIVAGTLFYYGYSRTREQTLQKHVQWLERLDRKEYRVLVALSKRESIPTLMETASALARQHDGSIVVATVVEVPEGVSLLSGRTAAREKEALLHQAVAYATSRDMTATPVLKIACRISHAIAETAREEQCNFLIMGQPSGHSFLERLVASVVDRVLSRAPCHVGVVYGKMARGSVGGILVPVTTGRNSQLAAELAPGFAAWFGSDVRAVTVLERGMEPDAAEDLVGAARETVERAGLEAELQVIHRREVGRGLARSARPRELVLVGGPSSGPTAPLIGETIPVTIAKSGSNPVVVVRAIEPRAPGRFERAFFGKS